ncbi:FUSC family protein [Mycobacterium sherrisii]|uniref:FUSC family protein n=1 Tax=Mycobacterium sherrisii TaxID=243061 RepID=UPI000A149ACD|nr:FUSC family protein [Mycobacterium sherrisii]MCV7029131.1 aromatic acid exporter family protein [Mycobacterium sherrisii]ORW75492.1 hypothetical protein AWC25_13705 [Mycobacterium sherrisii]
MSTSLLTHPFARAAVVGGAQRVRGVWFNLLQTSVAAGLSWYIAHDVLAHPQPFFAPIAAAVSLSTSNVLRAQRAIQMIIGVTVGIGTGTVVQELLGPGTLSVTLAALIALLAAVFIGQGLIGQGMMFANQTVVSSILVIALYRSGVGWERIFDALIGGGLAIVIAVLLFPANPLMVLRSSRLAVLGTLEWVLQRTGDLVRGRETPAADWPLPAVDRVHEQLGGLIQARTTSRQIVRVAPRRWGLRDAVRAGDQQAVQLALLAGAVLQLARVVVPASVGSPDGRRGRPSHPAAEVLDDLRRATALADADPAAATGHVDAARRHAASLLADARERTEVVLADVVQACIDDLQRVIDLATT